jgi:hypothetical protein
MMEREAFMAFIWITSIGAAVWLGWRMRGSIERLGGRIHPTKPWPPPPPPPRVAGENGAEPVGQRPEPTPPPPAPGPEALVDHSRSVQNRIWQRTGRVGYHCQVCNGCVFEEPVCAITNCPCGAFAQRVYQIGPNPRRG